MPTHAQIGLWPAPRGGFTIADANAIKVSEYHGGFSNSIVTDRQQLIADVV
jgi:hypothetical protein